MEHKMVLTARSTMVVPPSSMASSQYHSSNNNSCLNGNDDDKSNNNKKIRHRIRRLRSFLNWQSKSTRTVRSSLPAINDRVEMMTNDSPFLGGGYDDDGGTAGSSVVVDFDRSEIQVGGVIGEGTFSKVYEVTAFDLDSRYNQLYEDEAESLCEEKEGKQSDREEDLVEKRGRRRNAMRRQLLQDENDGRKPRYVIKLLKKKLLRKPKLFHRAAARLIVEARFMRRLDHPNILQLRGFSRGGTLSLDSGCAGGLFLVMDRLEETLEQRIEKWKELQKRVDESAGFPEAKAHAWMIPKKAVYALQMARALQYLHERRIVFRDLKPSNVGFAADDAVRLFDFGLCRELPPRRRDAGGSSREEEYFRMSACGTPRYMAVELLLSGRYNEKADVYSWAMTFYEMLRHEKPFKDMSVEDHYYLACECAKRPNLSDIDGLPSSINQLIQDAWKQLVRSRCNINFVCDTLERILEKEFDHIHLPHTDKSRSVDGATYSTEISELTSLGSIEDI